MLCVGCRCSCVQLYGYVCCRVCTEIYLVSLHVHVSLVSICSLALALADVTRESLSLSRSLALSLSLDSSVGYCDMTDMCLM